MKKFTLLSTFLMAMLASSQAQTTIQDARAQGAGATVTITGIATNGSEFGSSLRYIQDNTGAIALYSSSLSNVDRGDEITVTGKLKDYSGLLEMDPVSSVNINSSNNTLPTPLVLTPGQLAESNEAQLVEIKNVTFTNGGSTFSSNTDYTFTDGNTSAILYLKTGNALVGTTIPTGAVNITGVVSEYNGKYEVLPRDANDITNTSALYYTSSQSIANLTTSGFDISWTTNKASNAFIQYGHTKSLELGILSGTTNSTSQTVTVSGANPSEIFYVKTFSVSGTDSAVSTIKTYITQSTSSGDMKVYFTRTADNSYSTGTNATTLNNLVDDTLIAYIGRAKESIDIAIYNMQATSTLSSIASAINTAYANGVQVRIVYDSGTTNSAISDLNSSIPKLESDNSTGLMHNKFVVIDAEASDANQPLVWTGSTNWSDDNINTDANNVIIIQDKSLALNYKLEFEEMWGSTTSTPNASAAKFGYNKEENTAHNFIIGGKQVESYFSPSDATNTAIIDAIGTADDQLFIETMLITRSDIGYAIDDAVDNGVETYCILNSEGESSTTVIGILQSGIGDHLVMYDQEEGVLHHKLMIADPSNTTSDPLVLTGSHNWSNAANEDNDENTLVIHDATIANLYLQEFMSRYNINWVSGIEELNTVFNNVTAYPNPATDYVQLGFNLTNNINMNIRLVDMLGKVVATQHYIGTSGMNVLTINTENISDGLYQLVMNVNGFEKSIKVMVK